MKTSKECVTCQDHIKFPEEKPCNGCYGPEWQMWSPIETKKMKSTPNRIIEVLKEMFTFSNNVNLVAARVTSIIMFLFLLYDGIKSVGDEPSGNPLTGENIFFVFMILIGIWLLGYFARRPNPNEKPLIIWLKICKLKIQIAILKKNLKPYTTLNKIKHQRYKSTREMVKEWRLELNELKRELKELV